MRTSAGDRRRAWLVDVLYWFPFRKRFSREEYEELFRLLGSETRALRRRPMYVVGLVVSLGLTVYLVATSSGGGAVDWRRMALGILVGVGYMCGVNSVREHLCERLLRLKQHPEELEGV